MNRREVIKKIAVISGGALLASSAVLQACHSFTKKRTALTQEDEPLLDEIAEIIIPSTPAESRGAGTINTGAYMIMMVNDCYSKEMKLVFIEGLDKFDQTCMEKFGNEFLQLDTLKKLQFLLGLQQEAKVWKQKHMLDEPYTPHYFQLIQDLTVSGYFSSEIGVTQARRYKTVPGSYHGCIPYKKGDKGWATS